MPRAKKRQSGGKAKNKQKGKQKQKQKDKKKNIQIFDAERIEREVKEIRLMIAKNNDGEAMNRINTIEQNLKNLKQSLPLNLNALKCAILSQCHEYNALELVFHEIKTNTNNKWDLYSLQSIVNSCKRSGNVKFLQFFLESALNDKSSSIAKTEQLSKELYFAYFVNLAFNKQSSLAQSMKRTFKSKGDEYTMWTIIGTVTKIIISHFDYFNYDKNSINNKALTTLNNKLNKTEDTMLKLQQFQFERQFLSNLDNESKKFANFDAIITVYCKILKLRNEWNKLNNFLDCDLMKIHFIDKNKLKLWKLESLIHSNQWTEVNALCSSLLFAHDDNDKSDNLFIDDWDIWTNWIDAQLVIYQNDEKTKNDKLSGQFIDENVSKIQKMQKINAKKRGPYLIEIEFYSKCVQFEGNDALTMHVNEDKMSDFVLSYFKQFASTNSCCFDDIVKYLAHIQTMSKQQSLVDAIKKYIDCQLLDDEKKENSQKQSIAMLQNTFCFEQISLFFGLTWTQNDEQSLINKATNLYELWHCNVDKVKKCEKTDEREADNLVLIGVHIFIYLAFLNEANQSKARSFLMDAILFCELALIKSFYNFRIKMYLLRLYAHPLIGCIDGAFKQFESMKIRGVQNESLAHIIHHDAMRYGFMEKCVCLHEEMLDHRREFGMATMLRTAQCFEHGNYDKAIEFAQFHFVSQNSEFFKLSQADYCFAKLIKFGEKKQSFLDILDCIELHLLPMHKYLQQMQQQQQNEEEFEWNNAQWIDLNDYKTTPIYIDCSRQLCSKYFEKFFQKSTIWICDASATKETKLSQIKLLLTHICILYKSLKQNDASKELKNMRILLKDLGFMKSENVNDLLSECNDLNFHWILVYCLYDLNRILFAESVKNNELFVKNLTAICLQFGEFSDALKVAICDGINKENKYEINGIHLQKIWKFVSILCFCMFLLFEFWINESNNFDDDDLKKVIVEKYRFVSKKVDGIKRTLSDILQSIESEFKIINIGNGDLSDKQMDKILKKQSLNELQWHKSNIVNESEDVNKLKTLKIALINMNNNILKNNIQILKQYLLLLKQLKFTV